MTDEQRLAQLGYKQELRRKLSGFSNFAVSFSIISILAGAITSYGIAMTAGGPATITLGWLFVGGMVVFVALAMAEICSVYPTAGALYWWAAALAKRNKAAWAWFVGWFNFLGEVAVTAAIDFGAAITTSAFFSLAFDLRVTAGRTFLVFLAIIVAHGLLNTFGVSLVRVLSDVSAVAEETHDAARSAPRGIVMSVVVSVIAGFVLLFAITWSIQDYDAERATALGLPPAQIFIDAVGHDLGTFLLFICVVAQFFCGLASVTANSRMAYAFSRDGALPGSHLWKRVNPRTGTPTNSIWLCVACSTALVVPSLWNTTAYWPPRRSR